MKLSELAAEYKVSAERCRERVKELEHILSTEAMGETERLLMRRRVTILTGMARETRSVSKYLENYYGGRRNEEVGNGE